MLAQAVEMEVAQLVLMEKAECLQRSSVCSGKFPLDPRIPFAFQPVEQENLAGKMASPPGLSAPIHEPPG